MNLEQVQRLEFQIIEGQQVPFALDVVQMAVGPFPGRVPKAQQPQCLPVLLVRFLADGTGPDTFQALARCMYEAPGLVAKPLEIRVHLAAAHIPDGLGPCLGVESRPRPDPIAVQQGLHRSRRPAAPNAQHPLDIGIDHRGLQNPPGGRQFRLAAHDLRGNRRLHFGMGRHPSRAQMRRDRSRRVQLGHQVLLGEQIRQDLPEHPRPEDLNQFACGGLRAIQLVAVAAHRLVEQGCRFRLLGDREIRIDAHLHRMLGQKPLAETVNRGHLQRIEFVKPAPPHLGVAVRLDPDLPANALAHGHGRRLRKRHRHHRAQGPVRFVFQHMQEPLDQDEGLARSGSRQHGLVAVNRGDGRLLFRRDAHVAFRRRRPL